ncbi:uncharacterized protein LY89DRAFT_666682 [Mollisia scopiformis]|uniref:Uncharacterized protein n=1 Tax=Mollisia scopiformis TaxID=149040 RepID=A0A194XI46_MOLSC|nr:uncharacterized protein LY89DRAFT_666682 [Mollisia scopiformis]KUJ19833.1 hypothetical protein LY89DRAFT_666682 [Mollisia scopiformis]
MSQSTTSADNNPSRVENVSPEPDRSTRSGTPLSPLSEELFGDILDTEPGVNYILGPDSWDELEEDECSPLVALTRLKASRRTAQKIATVPSSDPPALQSTNSSPSSRFYSDPRSGRVRTAAPATKINSDKSSSAKTGLSHGGGKISSNKVLQGAKLFLSFPLFCSRDQVMQNRGGYTGVAVDLIKDFERHVNNVRAPIHLAEPIFTCLSQARHIFEVTMDTITRLEVGDGTGKKKILKELVLARYFMPSAEHEDKYVEIHAKDVGPTNPALAYVGATAKSIPRLTYTCACGKKSEELAHVSPRKITFLKNYRKGFTFTGQQAREVTGEWLVGGESREWGMPLRDAKVIWTLEAQSDGL